jgi:electron transport complex protein RnfE
MAAINWQINVFDGYSGMLLALLPPGAFIALGLLIALKNMLANKA